MVFIIILKLCTSTLLDWWEISSHLLLCSIPPINRDVWGTCCKFSRILCSNKGFGKGPLLRSPSHCVPHHGAFTPVGYLLLLGKTENATARGPSSPDASSKALPLKVFPHHGPCQLAESAEVKLPPLIGRISFSLMFFSCFSKPPTFSKTLFSPWASGF